MIKLHILTDTPAVPGCIAAQRAAADLTCNKVKAVSWGTAVITNADTYYNEAVLCAWFNAEPQSVTADDIKLYNEEHSNETLFF